MRDGRLRKEVERPTKDGRENNKGGS